MGGKVTINSKNLKFGIIKIGKHSVGTLDMNYERTVWQNNGNVIFNGTANIGSGTRLYFYKC